MKVLYVANISIIMANLGEEEAGGQSIQNVQKM